MLLPVEAKLLQEQTPSFSENWMRDTREVRRVEVALKLQLK